MTTATPRLRAVTRRADGLPDLVALANPHDPLLWVRGERGFAGIGELVRLEFHGPDRFTDAARAWRDIARRAIVDDEVDLPGTGLVALGTFTFSDAHRARPAAAPADGTEPSVLIVPERIIARNGDVAWVTQIAFADDTPAATSPADDSLTDSSPADTSLTRDTSTRTSEIPHHQPSLEPSRWVGADLTAAHAADPRVNAYLDGVREANERIARGDVEKVVLARQLTVEVPADADFRVPLSRLAAEYLDCWTFAIDGLLGASPETLVRRTNGAVSARVLAGTRTRVADDPVADARARDDLLTSDKDQHEHAFAVQSVVTALSPYLPDLRTSEEPFALRLPNVWHLATDLGATSSGAGDAAGTHNPADRHGSTSTHEPVGAIDLVGALHPTAAVAGTPTAKAVEVIAELEPFDRGRYAGAVGWVDAHGDGEWVIALRCAQVGAPSHGTRRVTASAGGGIVLGSDPAHELAETVSKFRPIAEALAPGDGDHTRN